MKDKGIRIQYGDIAPEAKENFDPTVTESEFDTLEQLKEYNLLFPNYGNICEPFSVALDGESEIFPDDDFGKNLGLWSKQISDEIGVFSQPIVLNLTSIGYYSSKGLSFTFDVYNEIFANRINIKWYTDDEKISEKDFEPDNAFFFCQNEVEFYNKIVVTFYSINMPFNRLKLRSIDYGINIDFYGDELRNVNCNQEIDPVSSEIAINSVDFVIDSKKNIEFSFREKQKLSIYFDGKLKATTFIKKSQRKSKKIWSIQSEDYIGLLDEVDFYGGIYNDEYATNIIKEIFEVAKIPYSVDEAFSNVKLSGYIPYTTCRQALMQVAFAIQAVVYTGNSDIVKIINLSEESQQDIPLNRILQGQSFSDESRITSIKITIHSYNQIDEQSTIYNSSNDGIGENIFVKFSEPFWDLKIEGNGDLIKWGVNFAIINARDNCILTGKKYKHIRIIKSKTNPFVLASEKENIINIDKATLISSNNIDNVLEKCYNYFTRNSTVNLKIVEGKHVTGGEIYRYGQAKYGAIKYGSKIPIEVTYDAETYVSQNVKIETQYKGDISGVIIKQSYNLNGGIIIKDSVIR